MTIVLAWLPAVPAYLIVLVALFAPGVQLGRAIGLRGRTLLVASVPLSTFIITTGAIVTPLMGIEWGWFALLLYATIVTALGWLARRYIRGFSRDTDNLPGPTWLRWELIAGVGIVAAFVTWAAIAAIKMPGYPPQTWDAVYHLSGVHYILESGNGSTFFLGTLSSPHAAFAFYPAGWHDVVALVASITGDVAIASNMTSLAFMTVVVPLGAGLFASVLFPTMRLAPLTAILAAAAVTAFPYRVASLGTLWPLLYAYALVPFVLALAVIFFGKKEFQPSPRLLVVLLSSVIGMGITHPQGVLAFLVLGIWLVLSVAWRVIRGRQEASVGGKVLLGAIVPTAVVGVLLVSLTGQGQSTTGWTPREPVGTVWGELWGVLVDAQLTEQGYGNLSPKFLLALLFVVGVVALIVKRQQLWLLPAMVTSTYLFLVAASVAIPGYQLIGLWYYDPPRLGAIIPLVYVPIAAYGAATVAALVVRMLSKRTTWSPRVLNATAAVVAALVMVAGTGWLAKIDNSRQLWINYTFKGESGLSGLVGPEEIEMIHRLADELPEDAVVLGNPFTGATMVYAIANREVLFKYHDDLHDPDAAYLANNFANLRNDPRVCEILDERGIEFFYTDSVRYEIRLDDRDYDDLYRGLRDAESLLDEFELVDQGGTAAVYRITGCD